MTAIRPPTAEQERLIRERLRYDPETGYLHWMHRPFLGKTRAGVVNWDGYVHVAVARKRIRAHRVIWFLAHGRWPINFLDHINGNKTDNRLCNLREATQQQNNINKPIHHSKSGMRGVFHHPSGGWTAKITVNRKQMYLGYFGTPQEAETAYKKASAQHFGEFAPQ